MYNFQHDDIPSCYKKQEAKVGNLLMLTFFSSSFFFLKDMKR